MSWLIAQAKVKIEAAKARLREMESDLKSKQVLLDQQIALDEVKMK